MELTLEELRKNYERFDDDKIIRLATEEASGLRPEALELLKQIIKERGLSDDIFSSIDVQIKEISESDLTKYCDILRKLPCPICSSTDDKLNATMTGSVISFIIMTTYQKELKIACPDCLDKLNNNAMIKSALLGWWSPEGIFRTIQSLLFNNKMKEHNRQFEANELFRAFVINRVGRIEANKNNLAELNSMIKYIR